MGVSRHIFKISVLLIVLGVSLGCEASLTTTNQSLADHSVTQPSAEWSVGGSWQTVSPGLDRIEYRFEADQFSTLVVYRINPEQFKVSFQQSIDHARSVAQWSHDIPSAVVVMNGVFFNEDFSPAGWVHVDDQTIANQSFFAWPGLISFGDSLSIIDTQQVAYNEAFAQTNPAAVTTFPVLISDDHITPSHALRSNDKSRRSFIGVDTNGFVYIGCVSATMITFQQLAQIIIDLPDVTWDTVVNVDGGSSTGLMVRTDTYQESILNYVRVPNVIIVEPK